LWLIGLMVFWGLATACPAQTSSLEEAGDLTTRGTQYYNQGDYTAAARVFERALAIREAQLGAEDLDVATSLSNVAFIYATWPSYIRKKPATRRRSHSIGARLRSANRSLGPSTPRSLRVSTALPHS